MTSTDTQAKARAIANTATNLRANRAATTRHVNNFAGTLTRNGTNGPTSHGTHSDPTANAALTPNPMRDIDQRWTQALASAAGWARNVTGTDCPTDLAQALMRASQAILTGAVGTLPTNRLYTACTTIDDIIGACRPTHNQPDDNTPAPTPRTCPACLTHHNDRRTMCNPCNQLHHRNPQHNDTEFTTWVQRRITEGTLSRPHSQLHQHPTA